jgi:hypothetical protein
MSKFQNDLETVISLTSKHKQNENREYWQQFKGLSWKEFNEKIGMPINTKTGLPTMIYLYEDELIEAYLKYRMVWVKKATGLGITEITNRFIAWLCTRDDEFRNNEIDVSVVIFTGASTKLAIRIVDRIKDLFKERIFTERETIGYINGAKIEAFPSDSTKTARGLSPFIVFVDEGDFFSRTEQKEVRVTAERYIIKTNPYIIFISTPNLPGGLYQQMEEEEPSLYHKVFLHYSIGLRDGMYTHEEIDEGKRSASFEREYGLQYGVGSGNIFQGIDDVISDYDLSVVPYDVCVFDPAFGSSNFGCLGLGVINGIIHIKEALELPRPSLSFAIEKSYEMAKNYKLTLVDSAHPGIIRDLKEKGINCASISFGHMDDNKQSMRSKMTTEAAQATREKRVRIHKMFTNLISQLRAVSFDSKGGPDKSLLTFDLGDCYLMGVNHLKTSKIRIISVNTNIQEDDY